MKASCPACGAPVRWLDRTCAECGEPNDTRRNVIAAAATVAVLAVATVAATLLAMRARPPAPAPAVTQSDTAPTVTAPAAPTQDRVASELEFTWLADTMKACDDRAAQDPDLLHLLVIPLADKPPARQDWKPVSINDIGNALVVPGSRTLTALKQGELMIARDEYVFGMRNAASGVVLRWEPATGVKWFTSRDGGTIKSFQLQIKRRDSGRDDQWGNAITRQATNCHWVNALLLPQ